MEQLGGERELFRQMVRFFFSDGLKLLPEIRAAAGAGDATTIERKAHRLKGTVLYLGAKAATAAVADVEILGRSGDLIGAAPCDLLDGNGNDAPGRGLAALCPPMNGGVPIARSALFRYAEPVRDVKAG